VGADGRKGAWEASAARQRRHRTGWLIGQILFPPPVPPRRTAPQTADSSPVRHESRMPLRRGRRWPAGYCYAIGGLSSMWRRYFMVGRVRKSSSDSPGCRVESVFCGPASEFQVVESESPEGVPASTVLVWRFTHERVDSGEL